jgi:hypothetical protein
MCCGKNESTHFLNSVTVNLGIEDPKINIKNNTKNKNTVREKIS